MQNFLRKEFDETLSWLLFTNHKIPCGMKLGILLLLHIRGTFKLSHKKKPYLFLSYIKTKFVKYIGIIVIMQVNTSLPQSHSFQILKLTKYSKE